MEYVLLGLLIISLVYIVKITLKYEHIIGEYRLNLADKSVELNKSKSELFQSKVKIDELEASLEHYRKQTIESMKVEVKPKLSPMEEVMQSLFQQQELKEVDVAKDFMKAWAYTGQPSIVKGVDNE